MPDKPPERIWICKLGSILTLNPDEAKDCDVEYILASQVAAEIEGLKSELSDAHLLVRSTQETIDKARQAAGHVEEAGEVCIPDCPGCRDPVGSLIADLRETRRLLWFERLAGKGAIEYTVELEQKIANHAAETEKVWDKAIEIVNNGAENDMPAEITERLKAARIGDK